MKRQLLEAYDDSERQRKRRRLRFTGSAKHGQSGVPYSWTPTIAGGTTPYTLYLEDGTLPNGLAIIANAISGTPYLPGTFNFWLRANDAKTLRHSEPFSITITA